MSTVSKTSIPTSHIHSPCSRQDTRQAVLVLGMHRSGTSALTRTLSMLGCDLPKHLMPATEANQSGYWESSPISKLNNDILISTGNDWRDWDGINPAVFHTSTYNQFLEQACQLISTEYGNSRLFALKDPRLCLLMPFWRQVFEEMEIQPVVIHTLRNPIEVTSSLQKRDKLSTPHSLFLWLRHILDAEQGSRGLTRFFTSYDDLLCTSEQFIQRSQEVLNLNWPRNTAQVQAEIDNFLSIKHRNHTQQNDQPLPQKYAAPWSQMAYDIMLNWVEQGENIADHNALDQLHQKLGTSAKPFSLAITELSQALLAPKNLEVIKDENQILKQTVATLKAERAEQTQTAKDLVSARENAQNKSQNLQQALAVLEAEKQLQRTEMQSRINLLRQEVGARAEHLDALEGSVANYKEIISHLREECGHRADHIKLLKTTLQTESQTLSETRQKLDTSVAEISAISELFSEQNGDNVDQNGLANQFQNLIHNILSQAHRSYLPHRTILKRQISLLQASGIFAADWYLQHYQDVSKANLSPEVHFILYGNAEGRAPNPIIARLQNLEFT